MQLIIKRGVLLVLSKIRKGIAFALLVSISGIVILIEWIEPKEMSEYE